jgi:hypothetical protein
MAPTLTTFSIALSPHIIPVEVISQTSCALASVPKLADTHIAVHMYQCLSTRTGWSVVPHLTSLSLGTIPDLSPSSVLLAHLKLWTELRTLIIYDVASADCLDAVLGALHDRVYAIIVSSKPISHGLLSKHRDSNTICGDLEFTPRVRNSGGIDAREVKSVVESRFLHVSCRGIATDVLFDSHFASTFSHKNNLTIRLRSLYMA